MVRIEAETLEGAYSQAAKKLSCSITQLNIEVIQVPKSGLFGMFKKQAIIVAACKSVEAVKAEPKVRVEYERKAEPLVKAESVSKPEQTKITPQIKAEPRTKAEPIKVSRNERPKPQAFKETKRAHTSHSEIIMPASFVTDQEEDDYDGSDIYADEDEEVYIGEETEISDASHDEIHKQLVSTYSSSAASKQAIDNFFEESCTPSEVAAEIQEKVDLLFKNICFDIDAIKVCQYDEKTILIEFTGKDAALLIGKEGYRYKALSYMLYNWINATYQLQLRLEIAEFLKNQEEMICKYLEAVYANIDRDGRAQTKILDGVLVQIALRELRTAYPDKYVAIRSTRDGAKFIIVNSFNNESY